MLRSHVPRGDKSGQDTEASIRVKKIQKSTVISRLYETTLRKFRPDFLRRTTITTIDNRKETIELEGLFPKRRFVKGGTLL